jgi:hypothetical protein
VADGIQHGYGDGSKEKFQEYAGGGKSVQNGDENKQPQYQAQKDKKSFLRTQ